MTETKGEILKRIREDYNSYTPYEVQQFLIMNVISESELLKAIDDNREIDEKILKEAEVTGEIIVDAIKRYSNPILEHDTNELPNKIKDYCTEVFFWGLADSGKTCALIGILNTINTNGYFKPYGNIANEKCISSDYLNGLLNVINNKKPINYLPASKTANTTIRYMNFKFLKDGEERKVAFIDLSGEVVKAIAKENIKNGHADVLGQRKLIESLLKNKNRKIHFFFIDYCRDEVDGKDENFDGINTNTDYIIWQRNYFTNLCAIFNSKGYFEKNTDFIYIVITKADKMICSENQRRCKAIKYFKEEYKSFRSNLGKICQDNEINFGDKYTKGDYDFLDNYILDFSIGKVLFWRMCRFDNKSSEEIVKIISEKTQKERSGIWSIFN